MKAKKSGVLIIAALITLFFGLCPAQSVAANGPRLCVPKGHATPFYDKLFEALDGLGFIQGETLWINEIDLPLDETGSGKEKINRIITENCDLFFTTGDHLNVLIKLQAHIPLVFLATIGSHVDFPESMKANTTGFYRGSVQTIFMQSLGMLPEEKRTKLGLIYFEGAGLESNINSYLDISGPSGFELLPRSYNGKKDIERVMREFVREGAGGVILFPPAVRKEDLPVLIDWQIKLKMPVIGQTMESIEAGALGGPAIKYEVLIPAVTVYIAKILKGRKPAQLPVRYFAFQYVINLNTASRIGIQIPQEVIAQAEIIGLNTKKAGTAPKALPVMVPGEYVLGVPAKIPMTSLQSFLEALAARGYVDGKNLRVKKIDLKGAENPDEGRPAATFNDEIDAFYITGNVLPTMIQLEELQTPVCFVAIQETAAILPDRMKNIYTGVIRGSFSSIVEKSTHLMRGARRMGMLAKPNSNLHLLVDGYRKIASVHGVNIDFRIFTAKEEIGPLMREMQRDNDYVLLFPSAVNGEDLVEIVKWQKELGFPVVGQFEEHVKAGLVAGLVIDLDKVTTKAAEYVDKIFQGRSPSQLPIYYYSEKYIINLRTVSEMRLTIPADVTKQAMIID